MKTIKLSGKTYKYKTGLVDKNPSSNYNLYVHIFENKVFITGTIIKTDSNESEIKQKVISLIDSYTKDIDIIWNNS